uniref:Uncharacterized protein n=1 Tax=Plectus sambesii TaxID=2011161 RepID=A0A914UKP2_9BILA
MSGRTTTQPDAPLSRAPSPDSNYQRRCHNIDLECPTAANQRGSESDTPAGSAASVRQTRVTCTNGRRHKARRPSQTRPPLCASSGHSETDPLWSPCGPGRPDDSPPSAHGPISNVPSSLRQLIRHST